MRKILFAGTFAFFSAVAHAAPLSFFDLSHATSVLAIAGVNVDSSDGSTLSSPLPLLTSALANSGDSLASSSAIADNGVLATLAEALGAEDSASALATAEFLGSFLAPGGPIELTLDFTVDGQADGAGFGTSLLHVILLSGSDILFDTTYSNSGLYRPVIGLVPGSEGLLSITLSSAADAPGATDLASMSGSLGFTVQAVPEPSSVVLLLLGGTFIAVATVRRARVRSAGIGV